MPDTVDTPCLAYNAMKSAYWDQAEALRGGTNAMRDAGATYLPPHSVEETPQWQYRRDRSFLWPAYDDAIQKATTKPFTKPISLNGDLPDKLAPMTANMDYSGRSLTQLGREVFDAAVDYGFTHLFVDFPATGGGQTEGDERSAGIRPTVVHYTPPALLGWNTQNGDVGQKVLKEIRIAYEQTEVVGTYEEGVVQYVRVVREGDWELWRKAPDDKGFAAIDTGTHSFGAVPLVTVYFHRTGFMTGRPCLQGLSEENVHHWQLSSDYKNCLHFNLAPMVVFEGAQEDSVKFLSLGSRRGICLEEGVAKILETSGSALAAGREELERCESRMRALSMEPFIQKTGTPTATFSGIAESRSQAAIISWVRSLESGLEDCFRMAGKWVNTELPDDFGVDIFDDFSLAVKSDADMNMLKEMYGMGTLDKRSLIDEVRRRGLFDEGLTTDEIMNRLTAEAPDLAGMED